MQPTKMGFVEAVKTCFSKAFTFTGRARRSEYWYWTLFSFLVSLPFSIFAEVVPEDRVLLLLPILGVYGLWALFQTIASLAVSVRRLHDIGRSGWWYGAGMIYVFVWVVVMVVWLCAVAYVTPIGEDTLGMLSPFVPWLIVCLITYLPYIIYSIVLLVWFCTDSTPGVNKYGENPKGVEVPEMCTPDLTSEADNKE
jgi:uncharacterized membrane protein YhaH (DUF805 family)